MSNEGVIKDEQSGRLDEVTTGGEPIEGGHVGPLADVPFEVRHRAQTARLLAIALIVTLGVSFFLHYGVTAYFLAKG
jgi:hypothetical protein